MDNADNSERRSGVSSAQSAARIHYAERLTAPLRWWVQATMMVASLWLAVLVAMAPLAATVVTAIAATAVAAGLIACGAARIEVDGAELRAGRAHIPLAVLGAATALDADEARRVAGVDADARAFLLLRPYLKRAVQVAVTDPADPTPYWLIATRHPDRLAAALTNPTT